MMARTVPGLFFAGEVLDVDAYTGGYNLQLAFSTGVAAGEGAAVDAGRVGGGEFPFDAPVVREVQAAPGAVVKGGLRPAGLVAQAEAPAEIEVLHRPGGNASARRQRQAGGEQQG